MVKSSENNSKEDISGQKSILLNEINQFHNVVLSFSEQSEGIKKICITVFSSFLVLKYANGIDNSLEILLISCMFPLICYLYEIYIDIYRCRMRANLNNKIRELEILNRKSICREYKRTSDDIKKELMNLRKQIKIEKEKSLVLIKQRKLIKKERRKNRIRTFIHGMYLIYLILILISIMLYFFF